MKMNLSQAARAVGKSRKTLYRHIDKGKLSSEKDDLGNHVIDVAELQRVYKEVDPHATDSPTDTPKDKKQVDTPPAHAQSDLEINVLKLENDHLKEQLKIERERLSEKDKRLEVAEQREKDFIEIIKTQTRQLEAPKPEPTAAAEVAPQPEQVHKRGFKQWLKERLQ